MKTLGSMKVLCAAIIAAAGAMSTTAYAVSAEAGKAIYNNSCINCHGEGSAGVPAQDAFWKIRLPRLNETYVQQKSDQELTDVILNGKRKMEPAVQGKPHTAGAAKIKPEQVPDLIAYIRSLKKKS